LQEAREHEDGDHAEDRDEYRSERMPVTSGSEYADQAVDDLPGQVYNGYRKHPLEENET